MQITLSFNPISVLSWLKTRFFDNMEDTQSVAGKNGFLGFTDAYTEELNCKNTLITHTTFLDNKFIDDTYKNTMARLKEEDENEYNIYALGHWGITGGTFFDKGNVNKRLQELKPPMKTGYFEYDYSGASISNIRWINDPNGYIRIYEEPKKGYPYVLSGDTSGDGSDWNTACLTNNITKEDVATIRLNFDEDLYARQVYCLGITYNEALTGIETNFSTHPNKELERLGYRKLYVREETPDSVTGRLTKRYGVNTNTKTRPLMLGLLRQEVREYPERIKDKDTLLEMTTFAKNEKGKPEAMQGAHDDMIMARAINCLISGQQRAYVEGGNGEVLTLETSFFGKKEHKQAISNYVDDSFIDYGGDDW